MTPSQGTACSILTVGLPRSAKRSQLWNSPFLGFGLGDAAHVPHLGVKIKVLVKMALIYKEPVYAQFLEVYHAVFPLGII